MFGSTRIRSLAVLLACAFVPSAFTAETTQLQGPLAFFQPYLGDWIGTFEVAEGEPAVTDVGQWEATLSGHVLRTTHALSEGGYAGESMIVYDPEDDRIEFYYFTSAGFHTSGHMEITGENEFVAYEAVTGNTDGITQVRSTSRLSTDAIEVSTQYLQNGEWTEPQVRSYRRPD